MNMLSSRFAALAFAVLLLAACGRKKSAEPVVEVQTPTTEKMEPSEVVGVAAQKPPVAEPDAAFLKEPAPVDERAAYEAWFKKHNLDLTDPAMLAGDADGDGVSNRDEFLAGTSPRDAASHPESLTAHPAIRFKEYNEVRLPLVLESVSGNRAVIRRSDGGETRIETVREGETLRGFPLRVTKLSERQSTDKDGAPVDRSQVLLEDTSTKERVTLVKNLPAKTSATYALLVSEDGKISVKVHAGEVFTWPGEPGASYQVLDLGRDQVVLQQQGTRKMWTIPRQ